MASLGPGPISLPTPNPTTASSFSFTLPLPNPSSSSSSTGTPTGTSTSGTPSPTSDAPTIVFSGLTGNATTCEPFPISWVPINATSAELSSITLMLNLIVASSSATQQTLTSSVSIQNELFNWTSVAAPPGQYYVYAGASPGANFRPVNTPRFFVVVGSNTSCLGTTSASSHASSVNKGAIAGGVIGGLAALALLLLGLLAFLRRRRNDRTMERGLRRHWGGLGSVDSKAGVAAGSPRGSPREKVLGGPGQRTAASTFVPPTHADVSRASSIAARGDAVDVPLAAIGESEAHNIHPNYSFPVSARTSLSDRDKEKDPFATPPEGTPASSAVPLSVSPPPSQDSYFDAPTPSPAAAAAEPVKKDKRASRTPRKPVPKPTAEDMASLEMVRSLSQNGSQGHSSSEGVDGGASGAGQVHYLIPDMPPPAARR